MCIYLYIYLFIKVHISSTESRPFPTNMGELMIMNMIAC